MSEITYEYHEATWFSLAVTVVVLIAIVAGLAGLAWLVWRRLR